MEMFTLTQEEIEQIAGAVAPVSASPSCNPFGPGGTWDPEWDVLR